MGLAYVAALILGLGTIVVQLVMSGSDGGDVDGDVHVDGDIDADSVELDADGHDAGHAGDADIASIFLSLRFWTFALCAFGMVGSLLHFTGLAGFVVTLVTALALGLVSGLAASWTFRALARGTTSSGATASDAIGTVGRVLVPVEKGKRGKIRIELRGQTIDYLATTDDAALGPGDKVLVEEVRENVAHVSAAPVEFLGSGD